MGNTSNVSLILRNETSLGPILLLPAVDESITRRVLNTPLSLRAATADDGLAVITNDVGWLIQATGAALRLCLDRFKGTSIEVKLGETSLGQVQVRLLQSSSLNEQERYWMTDPESPVTSLIPGELSIINN